VTGVAERSPLIDHLTLPVSDLGRSRSFYEVALEPFGARAVELEDGAFVGIGTEGNEDLWLRAGGPTAPVHLAFASPDRGTVDAFHAAALAAGGRDNGAPGPRPRYHRHYYAAYVLDPDGNNVEAVCHDPP
jgi:catechol 2,3-dioxygenase-like lactoylglutathione lyase family enzyme